MAATDKTFATPEEEITYLKEQNQIIIETFERKIRLMQQQMDEMIKRLYGRSSEKLDPNQLLMQEMLVGLDKNAPRVQAPAIESTSVVKEHVRHKHGRCPLPEHLKRVEHLLDINGSDKMCSCGKALVHIGDDVTERIEHQPSSLFVNAYRRPKYVCDHCASVGVKQAPMPEGPIDKCEADCGMLAHVIEEKFEHHTPLYRQELKFERQGVNISRQTMADWMAGCAQALKPLYELMRQEILSYDIVLNDDTPVDMKDGPTPGIHTARFWATVGGKDLRYTMYNFTLGRGADGPEEFFKGYRGYFVSDAYAGYNELFKLKADDIFMIINAACWTHARRYFIKAQDSAPKAAAEILTLIARLYKIEDDIKRLGSDMKLAVRQKEAVPIVLEKIKPWLEKNLSAHLPQSPMRQAVEYTLGIWKELNVYLTDGRIPIDNNLAENAIRPIALGRKNWLFVGSETGGHTAATLMTFTSTCRKNKINTWAYLKDILQRINAHPVKRLHELLPDQWQAAQQPSQF
jgi:transposase